LKWLGASRPIILVPGRSFRRDDAISLSTQIGDALLQSKLRAILALHFADVGAQEHILSSTFGEPIRAPHAAEKAQEAVAK
jgi:hypothetical protein